MVQYPNYKNTLQSGTQIAEYGFTEVTEMACTALIECCRMMSLLLIMLLMSEVLLRLTDTNPHSDSSFQEVNSIHSETQPMWISFCPHYHPERCFVQLHVQQEVTSDQKICRSWDNGKSWTEPMNWHVQTHSHLKIKRSGRE